MNETKLTTTIYWCDSCEKGSEEAGPALYECGGCGNVFNADAGGGPNGNRCEQCNKFAAKLANESCPECGENEVETVEGFQCACHDEWHRL